MPGSSRILAIRGGDSVNDGLKRIVVRSRRPGFDRERFQLVDPNSAGAGVAACAFVKRAIHQGQ